MKTKFILLALVATLVLAGCSGCASLQTQKQKIAVACESAATAADAIAAGVEAGRVTHAQAVVALDLYRATVPFCQPTAESLTATQFAQLLAASARLTTLAEESK